MELISEYRGRKALILKRDDNNNYMLFGKTDECGRKNIIITGNIIDNIAEALSKSNSPTEEFAEQETTPTNFDKITESVESLAKLLVEESKQYDRFNEVVYWGYGELGRTTDKNKAIKSTIKWLKETDDER